MTIIGTNSNVTAVRSRGSLTDVVTLVDYPFYYDPTIKNVEKTGYASRDIIGNRLPSKLWIGQGSGDVDLEAFLLDMSTMQTQLDNFRNLCIPQDDIGAPHPVYVNVGGMFVGRWFVLCALENVVTGLTYDNNMIPYEARLKFKLEEMPVNPNYVGTGARNAT